MVTATKETNASEDTNKVLLLPGPNSDFCAVIECVIESERALLKNVRGFMENKVAPVIDKFWEEDSFPFELLPGIRDLKIAGLGYEGYGCAGGSTLLAGLAAMEIAWVDCSRDFLWRPQGPGDHRFRRFRVEHRTG